MTSSEPCGCGVEGVAEGYEIVDRMGVRRQQAVAAGRVWCTEWGATALYTIWVRMAFQRFDPGRGSWADVPGTAEDLVQSMSGDGELSCVNEHVHAVADRLEQELWRASFELRRPVQLAPVYSQPFRVLAPAGRP